MSSPYLWLRCGNVRCRRNLNPDQDTIDKVPEGLREDYLHEGGDSLQHRVLQCLCGHVTKYGRAPAASA